MPTTYEQLDKKYQNARRKLAERDRLLEQREATILEQQANAYKDAKIIRKHLETIDEYQRIAYQQRDGRLAALEKVASLESALASERLAGKIEGLEELPSKTFDGVDDEIIPHDWMISVATIRRMAAELKEGK